MRPARALIDLQALCHNYQLAKHLSGARALAVVKADAYGHGAVQVARALAAQADGFAVATLDEALELRAAGIAAPILLLEGFFEAQELVEIQQNRLWCVLHAPWQIDALERSPLTEPLVVWLEIDSGMHRLGIEPDQLKVVYQRLRACSKVADIILMSHFAQADALDSSRTNQQLALFNQARIPINTPVSLNNSPAILGWPNTPNDWVRAGIMLYGASPFADPQAQALALQPVMTLESRVIAVRTLPIGEPIGYGGHFVCQRPTRVGVVALGYADGYPRHAPNGTPVAVDGHPATLIGRVSMDMLTVDLTDLPRTGLGSRVELWGTQVSASSVADHAQTIAYQLFCNLKRAKRVYLNSPAQS